MSRPTHKHATLEFTTAKQSHSLDAKETKYCPLKINNSYSHKCVSPSAVISVSALESGGERVGHKKRPLTIQNTVQCTYCIALKFSET